MTLLPTGSSFGIVQAAINPRRYTREGLNELQAHEQAGRLVRDAKTTQVGVVRGTLVCELPTDSTKLLADPIWFGHYHFVNEEQIQCFFGCKWICPEDRPTRTWENAADLFDVTLDIVVPAIAENYVFHKDHRGMIDGALVAIYALDSVPSDFKILLDYMYIGTALRY